MDDTDDPDDEELLADETILEILSERGWSVDFGDLIDGPFIPDGMVRICDAEGCLQTEGASLQEAYFRVCTQECWQD